MSSENNFRNEGWDFNGFEKYYLKEEMRGEVRCGRGSLARRRSLVGGVGEGRSQLGFGGVEASGWCRRLWDWGCQRGRG